jgi:hypothetical protein
MKSFACQFNQLPISSGQQWHCFTPPDVTILYKLRYLGDNVVTSSKRHINAEGSHYMTIFGSQEANNNILSCSNELY